MKALARLRAAKGETTLDIPARASFSGTYQTLKERKAFQLLSPALTRQFLDGNVLEPHLRGAAAVDL